MNEKLLEVGRVAKRLNLHPATVRKMVKAGVLESVRTGPSKTRIRIPETALLKHLEKDSCNEMI
jgi:excisionase family DNA binding protein